MPIRPFSMRSVQFLPGGHEHDETLAARLRQEEEEEKKPGGKKQDDDAVVHQRSGARHHSIVPQPKSCEFPRMHPVCVRFV